MLELRTATDTTFHRGYAGDTYNSAIYAKRWNSALNVAFCSALGTDSISHDMMQVWKSHDIDCSLLLTSPNRLPGIYSISIDDHGERSFDYWRDQSAATQLIPLLNQAGSGSFIGDHDVIYVSGISFAILDDDGKQGLLDLLSERRSNGAKIAYDPNYRARMWRSTEHAKAWNDKVYEISDIAFPGLEDHSALYQHENHQQIRQHLNDLGVSEIVIKCDADGVYAYQENTLVTHQPFVAAPQQIDSTAAGDSFAGTYLAARLNDAKPEQAIIAAMAIAGLVVQHKGAIMPLDDFEAFKAKFLRHSNNGKS